MAERAEPLLDALAAPPHPDARDDPAAPLAAAVRAGICAADAVAVDSPLGAARRGARACGVGVIIPVMHIVVAALLAIPLRANVAIAAA